MAREPVRCEWPGTDPLMVAYHDEEWGVPLHDDRKLFEFLILEGAQAGLSWSTILKKRPSYRKAFEGFDPKKISKYGAVDTRRLLADAGIVRNRLKAAAAVTNAQAFLETKKEFGTFDVPRPTISLDSDLRNYNAGGSRYVQRNEGGIRNREGSP